MHRTLLVLVVFAVGAAGCGDRLALPSPAGAAPAASGRVGGRDVRQTGKSPVTWRRFTWGSAQVPDAPTIMAGPDGNLWYTDAAGMQLLSMNMLGRTARHPLPSFKPTALALGADSKFYAGDADLQAIDVLTTGGAVHQVALGDKTAFDAMTLGPDGDVWFMERAHVGKVTPAGAVTEYAYADATTNNSIGSIATGPDGDVWAAEYSNNTLDKINPSSGAMTTFALGGCAPQSIVAAVSVMYVACADDDLLQVTTAGSITPIFNAFGFPSSGKFLAIGPDGNPWFGTNAGSLIGEYNAANNSLTYFLPPADYGIDDALAAGPDGNLWAVQASTSSVAVYILNVIAVSPAALTLTSIGQKRALTVTEPGTTAWTATSMKPAIATVAQGSPSSSFTVTAVAVGATTIIVTDVKGNSFSVRVTVQ